MPSLGVSSLDLGRCSQRPFFCPESDRRRAEACNVGCWDMVARRQFDPVNAFIRNLRSRNEDANGV